MNVQVTARVPEEIKNEAEKIYSQYGLDINDAIRVFLTTSVREHRFPIDISKPVKVQENKSHSEIDYSKGDTIEIDPKLGHSLLPKEMDFDEDNVYDELYGDLYEND